MVRQPLAIAAMPMIAAVALVTVVLLLSMRGTIDPVVDGQRAPDFAATHAHTERVNHGSRVDAHAEVEFGLGPPPAATAVQCSPIPTGHTDLQRLDDHSTDHSSQSGWVEHRLLLFNRIPKCGSSFLSHIIKVSARRGLHSHTTRHILYAAACIRRRVNC